MNDRTRKTIMGRGVIVGSDDSGQALAEFAVLAPLLILLLAALLDFGRVFNAWVVATNAAREGARYAAVYSAEDYLSDARVVELSQQKAYDYLTGGLGSRGDTEYSLSEITVNVSSRYPGQPVTVSVSVRVQLWHLLSIFLSNQVAVVSQATMRI